MSGGVDSSVAAALLVEQGYEVIGMMMRLWSEPEAVAGASESNRCCTPDQMADARRVAHKLDIPFYVLDVQEKFHNVVVEFFVREHLLGRTPNPCVECNRQIRFSHLLNHALALGATRLATGHHARIRLAGDRFELLKGRDERKDQSYVLHVLGQQQLAQTLFPIGPYTKTEVREMAVKFDLPVASKGESQDLCFLSDGDYRRFLQERDPRIASAGPIVDSDGRELGQHAGLSFYTIGQRKGLNIHAKEPLFVLKKDVVKNALVVGSRVRLRERQLAVRGVNWVSGRAPETPVRAMVKVRYRATPVSATLSIVGEETVQVTLDEPVAGITPGQSAVFYDGEVCRGGGIIADPSQQL